MGWLARKSAEHQLRNTAYGLRKLVAAADLLTAAWDAGGQPTGETLAEFQRCKNKLVTGDRTVCQRHRKNQNSPRPLPPTD